MKAETNERRWWLKSLTYLLVATILGAGFIGLAVSRAAGPEASSPAWSAPATMTIKMVSPLASAQNEPNLLENLDCSLVTYRLVASSTMQTGCFTDTAFGMIDSDTDTVIFNGTDEGLPLLAYTSNQVLAPWPETTDLVTLDPVSTGGSYMSLYKNPLSAMQDQRNLLLQLTAKQLIRPPELPLKGPDGQRLVINPATLAFSDNGAWAVAETLGGSFIRINLSTLDMTPFAPAYGSQGSPALLKSRVTISDDGHFVAIANDAAGAFKVYDLTGCAVTTANLQPENCPAYDYRPFAERQIGTLRSIRHVRFVNDGLLSFEAHSTNPANDGIYELAPTDRITSLIDYLGLGDSYTSGEGAFDYMADTDSPDNMCHLSARSYPLLLTHDLFTALGGHSVACSGAVINDVGSTSDNYRGQVRGVASFKQLQQSQPALLAAIMTNFAPGYVAQQRFVRKYQPGAITVSIGGNDVGFGDMLETCVEPHVSRHLSDSTCFNTYEDRLEVTKLIDRTVPQWTKLYKQLRGSDPGGRLYAIGYPQIIKDTGNCSINVTLSKSELEFAAELVDYLNSAAQKAADSAGAVYVDISQALAGHRLCETASYNLAVNGLTFGKDGKLLGIAVFGKESYHPNALGQQLIEQAILQKTHNLTDSPATPAPAPDNQKMLNKPKSGRQVVTRVPSSKITSKITKKRQPSPIKVAGSAAGLKAHSSYKVRLDGPNGPIIGDVTSDENGDIDTEVTMPEDAAPGGHTIDVTGDNQADEPVDITQPVYVPVGDDDADGDGISDSADPCPYAINSGQDNDSDGIDDICDPMIGTAPAGPSSSTLMPATGAITSLRVKSSLANVLGTKTVNPTAAKNLRQPKVQNGTANAYRALTKLPVINWLYWAVLPIIAWLLCILAACLVPKRRGLGYN